VRPPARVPAVAVLAGVLILLGACGGTAPPPAAAAVDAPARRIVALAPHLTELAFAAGAGGHLVGVVEFSDHPPEARALPRVGDAFRLDLEALAAARPDLILGWPSGNSPATLARLRRLGYRVVELEPRRLADVGDQIEAIGRLAGTDVQARQAASAWRRGLAALESRYRSARPGRVFYQIAPQPLMTVNREHFIGQAIELCGGENLFADVPALTPVVSVESVVAGAPDVIVANDYTRGPGSPVTGSPLDSWRSWPRLPAVAGNRLFVLDPDLMSVPGPRLLTGITQLCAVLNDER
jgi:iron complex transport system substrate-binding protein